MFKATILFLALLLCLTLAVEECQHRDYGYGSTVCVCDNRHCDKIDPLKPTPKGTVTIIRTSKDGQRFNRSEWHFNKFQTPEQAITIRVDKTKRFQKIIGFGGAFTDASGFNIAKLDEKLQKRLIEDYFSTNGIEYNMGRITIGGSDFSTRPYSYDDHPKDDTLSTFALQEEDIKYKIPYLTMAASINPKMKYFGTAWSAPAWMKTNKALNNGGSLIGEPGGKYYKLFAQYMIKFLQAYEKNNVTLWGLTVVNEPGRNYFNSLELTALQERDYIKKDLGPALQDNGYGKDKIKLMIYDFNINQLASYVNEVLGDKEATKYISGVAFHWYENKLHPNREALEDVFAKHPEFYLLSTEACEDWSHHEKHVYLGSWATADRYADDIIKDLNHHTTGWVDWNLVLDLMGGPNWVNNFVDAPIIVNVTANEYYKQPIFYVLGHFSKLLPEGSQRIGNDIHMAAQYHDSVQVVSFQRPDNGIVVTVLNTGPKPVSIEIDDDEEGKLITQIDKESLNSFVWY